jgi:hypothetical protein
MKPIYIHSGMVGAPQYANANDNIISILEACLVNGFNTKTATSASSISGVLTLNFASNPGFEPLQTVELAASDAALVNGQHRVVANANNQVTIAIAGLPDGAVGSTGAGITIKQAGAGWSKPFSASTKAVFRPATGNRRFLRVVNAVGANVQARGYEDMTDVDTGTNPFPTVAQQATPVAVNNFSSSSPANAPWFLIATNKWMHFELANALVPTAGTGAFWFADLAKTTIAGDTYSTFIRTANAIYAPRNYTQAVGAISFSEKSATDATATWPSVLVDGAQFIPYVPVLEATGNVLRGVLPNAYKIHPNPTADKFLDLYSNVAGSTSRMKPIGAGLSSALGAAIAIDEEAWD